MLPESKEDFPKLLFLDQNKWIDLSRVYYGHSKGEHFRDALAAVRKAVENGKLVVPFSWVNMVEMNADPKPKRRERLARFIVDLSGNRSILPYRAVCPCEVWNAVHAYFGHPEPILIRRSLVRNGFAHALGMRLRIRGLPAKDEDALQSCVETADDSVQCLLARGDDRKEIQQFREEEIEILGFQEKVRKQSIADITLEQRHVAELFDHLCRGDVGTALTAALQEINRPFRE